jgi:hypothetical protein
MKTEAYGDPGHLHWIDRLFRTAAQASLRGLKTAPRAVP